jgi:ParB-like chromosome segregation protein Spo0J
MGELQVIYLPLSALTPDEKNAKQHPADQVEQIKESIKTFKMCDPIGIAGDENLIIEGHGRYMALQELGVKEAPCIRLDHLDTAEKRKAYALIHNKTTMNSGFDI